MNCLNRILGNRAYGLCHPSRKCDGRVLMHSSGPAHEMRSALREGVNSKTVWELHPREKGVPKATMHLNEGCMFHAWSSRFDSVRWESAKPKRQRPVACLRNRSLDHTKCVSWESRVGKTTETELSLSL